MMIEIPEALKFENLLKKVDADKDNSPLPDINMAMFEDDVALHDDLSNTKKYNDRYVELVEDESVRGNFALYLFLLFHHAGVICFIYAMVEYGGFVPFIMLMLPVLAWLVLFAMSVGMRGGG